MSYRPPNPGSVLEAPARETGQLEMPDNLTVIDECIEKINSFYSKVSDIWPGGLPDFEITTVNELIQEHFSGDFEAIAGNGDACVSTGEGLSEISGSITEATAELMTNWTGEAALGFGARMGLFAAATEAAGLVVQQGQLIFDLASTACREIGETVARIIGQLIEIAVRLISKIASKLNWLSGLVSWVRDAFTGFEDIREIVEDAQNLWDGITWLIGAKDAAYEFFDSIGTAFEIFNDLKDLVASIPDLANGGLEGAGDFARRARRIQNDINDLKDDLTEQLGDDAEQGEADAADVTAGAPS